MSRRVTPQRPWTGREVAQLRAWRMQPTPVPFAECARRLGRTIRSVVGQAERRRIVTRMYYPHRAIRATVRRLVRKGFCDAEIAYAIGRSRQAARYHRRQMGLPINRQRTRTTRGYAHPECFCCGAFCPKANHIEAVGWVSRKHASDNTTETYCPTCFAKYGWPAPMPGTATEQAI